MQNITEFHRNVFNEISIHRKNRIKKIKDEKIKEKLRQVNEKLAEFGIVSSKTNDDKDEAPRDFEFEFGLIKNRIDSPKMLIPKHVDSLYVNRPIDRYEPIFIVIYN